MAEPIIFNETDFEENLYDFYTYMQYKGKPFTGTVIIDNSKLPDVWGDTKQIVDFKDGNAHGCYLEYAVDGMLMCDAVYSEGELVSEKWWHADGSLSRDWNYYSERGKDWYPSGRLKELWDGIDHYLWDDDGTLVKKNGIWYYTNGQQMEERLPDETRLYYAPSGEIALREEFFEEKSFESSPGSYTVYKKYFYDDVFHRFRNELFADHHHKFDKKDHWIITLFGWVSAVYTDNPEKGNQVIDDLISHPNKETSNHASYLKRLAQQKESGSTEPTHWLEHHELYVLVK